MDWSLMSEAWLVSSTLNSTSCFYFWGLCALGGFCLQLSQLYPKLRFVVQDRAPVLEQAKHAV